MIEVVAVARALGAPHPCERAVERVAEPMHDEQATGRPQPDRILVGQRIGHGDADRRQHAEGGQVIGHHPGRQAAGDPLEHAPLGASEQEGLLTRGGHHDSFEDLLTIGR